jgi:hypothetical protein
VRKAGCHNPGGPRVPFPFAADADRPGSPRFAVTYFTGMIHTALVASLIASGIVPIPSPRDSVIPTVPSATGGDAMTTAAIAAASGIESGRDSGVTWVRGQEATSVSAHLDAVSPIATLRAPVGPRVAPSGFARGAGVDDSAPATQVSAADTVRPRSRRPRAIEYSDWYYRRLMMHRIASFAEYPLFAGEYILGERLLHDERLGVPPSGLRTAHSALAGGLGVVFGFNTITGGWNLWASRHDPAGRPRRLIHSLLMLVSDAGFAATGASGGGAKHSVSNAQLHRSLAEASMGVALTGTVMMWLWRN